MPLQTELGDARAIEADLSIRDRRSPEIERADAKSIEATLSIRDRLDLQEGALREDITKKITKAFIIVNLGVLLLVLLATILDDIFIYEQTMKSSERLVTANLLMSVVAATTVQFGAIALAMSNWLYPRSK